MFRQRWGQISSIVGCLALCVVVAIFRVNFGDHRGLAPLEIVELFPTKICGLRSFIRISEMMETVPALDRLVQLAWFSAITKVRARP